MPCDIKWNINSSAIIYYWHVQLFVVSVHAFMLLNHLLSDLELQTLIVCVCVILGLSFFIQFYFQRVCSLILVYHMSAWCMMYIYIPALLLSQMRYLSTVLLCHRVASSSAQSFRWLLYMCLFSIQLMALVRKLDIADIQKGCGQVHYHHLCFINIVLCLHYSYHFSIRWLFVSPDTKRVESSAYARFFCLLFWQFTCVQLEDALDFSKGLLAYLPCYWSSHLLAALLLISSILSTRGGKYRAAVAGVEQPPPTTVSVFVVVFLTFQVNVFLFYPCLS